MSLQVVSADDLPMRHLSRWYFVVAGSLTALGFATATSPVWGSAVTALAAFTALAAIVYSLYAYRPRRPRAWRLLAATLTFWGLASTTVAVAAATSTAMSSLVGQLIYVPGLIAIALTTIELTRRMGPLRVAGLEAAIGALGLGSFLWVLVLGPNVDPAAVTGGVAAIVYPLFDLALLMLLLRVVFSPLVGLRAARLLAGASLLVATSDALYFSPLLAKNVLAVRLINALYIAAYTCFGAAALQRSMRRLPARRPFADAVGSRRLLVFLGCALAAMPVALFISREIDGTPDLTPIVVIGTVTVLLVLARVWGLMRHLESLRRRAEASEQRFRMVFDSAGHGMSIGSNGMMTETNAALRKMLGYTSAELAQMHFTETTHPDDLTLAEVASDEVMSGKRPSHTFEKRLVRRDGSSFWVAVTLTRAQDGSFGISLIDDITARKELEDELRQAQKMEAVGKLAGGIAHDFNNVMTAVSGCAELLLSEIGEDDPRRGRVEVIHESAARATKLTRQLLAFSRRQVLRLEPVDLAEVAAGLEEMLERLLPPDISVSYDLAPSAIAQVDRAQLEQVLLNLALNARDSMPAGGNIAVSVRTVGEEAELTVADDGVGMSEETQTRIFEPFFTTKRAGTGLGLSTVDGIVAQSGGTVTVMSEPGHGSTFTIRFPRVQESPAPEPAAPEKPSAELPGRILLADDEDLVRLVTAELMSRHGYEVVCAASGEKALLLLDDSFDALVTDVAMTGMNGQTLAHRVRERFPALPVLFISGYPAEVLTGQQMVDVGEEVLTKPFSPDELMARLELVRHRAATLAAA
jgi:two-component system, cell cycle sensor histidine kinase and response regulator CckA